MSGERWDTRDTVFIVALVVSAVVIVSGTIGGHGCAALRQHAEQARAGTAAVIEAPQRVESGATVTEALGAAVTANIEKTDVVSDRLDALIATKIGGDGDSVALWIAIMMLGLGQIGDFIDRRMFHKKSK